MVKGGLGWGLRFGSGLLSARLPDGTWSAPSAIVAGGFSFGGQIGVQINEVVFVLNTDLALKAFSGRANFTLGSALSFAAGPRGRAGEILATKSLAPVYTYAKSIGLFAGMSLEGTIFKPSDYVNQKAYNVKLEPGQILSGLIKVPEEAKGLLEKLKKLHQKPKLHLIPPRSQDLIPLDKEIQAICSHNFDALVNGDLEIKIGDLIQVTKRGNGWLFGKLRGKEGVFPAIMCDVRL